MAFTHHKARGFARHVLGWALIGLGLWIFSMLTSGTGLLLGTAMILAGSAVLAYGVRAVLEGRRLSQETADEKLRYDRRPPVVFLRAFEAEPWGLDSIFGFTRRFQLLPDNYGEYQGIVGQQRFAKEMDEIGPFIALGRPGEKLPGFGAARKYVSDSDWKDTITDWSSRAALIVIWARPPKKGPGFDWELRTMVELDLAERILLVCPARESEYQRFREAAGQIFPRSLPQDRPPSWLMTFDANWNAIELDLLGDRTQPPNLFATLQPLLERNGIALQS